MSSVVKEEPIQSTAVPETSRWKYHAADHWAKSVFRETGEPISDSEVQHNFEPYSRELPATAAAEELPRIEPVAPRRTLLALAAVFWRCGNSWLASAVLHAGVMIALAFFTLPKETPVEDVFLTGGLPAPGESRLRRVTFKAAALPTRTDATVAPQGGQGSGAAIERPQKIAPPQISSRATGIRGGGVAAGAFGDALAMVRGDRAIRGVVGEEPTEGGAEFFGVQASGQRFVFVVDSSLSMAGPKWQAALRELVASIDRLTPQQYFYVIFFDGDSHPMFGQSLRISAMEQASPQNIANLKRWLNTMRLGYNTSPCESVKHAVHLQPDAVFLLSDGDFNDFTAGFLRKHNHEVSGDIDSPAKVVVHTICFRSRDGQRVLKRIAKENGGTYRFVK